MTDKPSPGETSRPRPYRWPLALSLILTVGYFGVWNGYFQADDFWHLGQVRFQTLGHVWQTELGYSIRILLDVVLWLQIHLFQLDARLFLGLSLLQHIAATLLVFYLARHLLGRPNLAFLAALLFGTAATYHLVVIYISESQYSLGTIFYLLAVGAFIYFLRYRTWLWYLLALAAFGVLLLYKELGMTLPLVVLAYHVLLGRHANAGRPWQWQWRDLIVHGPYWVILAGYLWLQYRFTQSGVSEAAFSANAYGPGWHVLGNFRNLIFMLAPNLQHGPVYNMLVRFIPATVVDVSFAVLLALGAAANLVAVWLVVRGQPVVKFLTLWIFITYLPYALWNGNLAQAFRYLYLPYIGFAILAASGLGALRRRLESARWRPARLAVSAGLVAFVLANVVVIQIWIRQYNENGAFRRAFVTELVEWAPTVPAGSQIYIEVPEYKYLDLMFSCVLVFAEPVTCQALWPDGPAAPVTTLPETTPVYWLVAGVDGLTQRTP